ncbi:MAG: MMPL family transporter [Actinomycetota bacterium]|nr:MMPL family transporter [Actinomycetota bacterium]
MSPLKRSNNFAARMGRWSANHWKTAVFGWLAFVVASVAIGSAVGTKYLETSDSNVGEARKADQIIDEGFPAKQDEQEEIVLIQSESLTAKDPAFQAAIEDVTNTLRGFRQVRELESPLAPGQDDQISNDGRAVMVTFRPDGDFDHASTYIEKIEAAVDRAQARHPDFYIEELGSVSTQKTLDEKFASMLAKIGLIAIPLALVILLFVFGSAVAALAPLLLAITAVVATIGLVALPSQLVAVDEQIAEVILLIGLAVGVDYSLFYLRREREERKAGRGESAALEAAAATSGRAVLISGLTVMIAMAGMFFSGDKTFMSFSIGTMMVVAVAMLGSLTVLPALLAKLGDRVEKGRIPLLHRLRSKDGEGRFWGAILDRVLRRPVVSAVTAAAVLIALTVPAFGINPAATGVEDVDIAEVEPIRKLEDAFPGGNDPARVAVKADDVASPDVREAIAELKRRALDSGQMNAPIVVDTNVDRTVATVDIPLDGKGTDDVSKAALATLRDDLLPATLGKVDGVEYAVTGVTAADKDWTDSMTTSAPLVFGFVLVFAFFLLTAAFRSVVVAVKAVVLNLLSVGAAYGLLVVLFQWGWGESLFGFQSNGGIAPWLPMFLFVILFGLSMDYHVFILSRVREAYGRGLSNEQAVAHGIKSTAGVVTSAATVMVATFAVFATMPIIDFKEMGIGLAAAVLIDATIVRAVLLPATMKLLGERNWYLPNWLGWLPKLEHDADRDTPVRAAPALYPAGR